MDEVENQGSVEEVANPQPEIRQDNASQEVVQKPSEDRDWIKRLRREREESIRRNKELEGELKAQRELLASLLSQNKTQQPAQQSVVDELEQFPDDEYLPAGKYKKAFKKLKEEATEEVKRAAQSEFNRLSEEKEKARFLEKLKTQFPDFQDVVNSETLAILEEQDPELANSIAALNDPYRIGLQSYKYIKALKIGDKAPDVRRAKEVEKRIEKNEKIIPSPLANDKRPIAQAFDMGRMSEEEKSKLYQEMMHYAGMAGGY